MARFERLDVKAYARRTGVSLPTAYRDFERFVAQQSDPTVVRIELEPVVKGKGALGRRMVVLWPRVRRPRTSANDNDR